MRHLSNGRSALWVLTVGHLKQGLNAKDLARLSTAMQQAEQAYRHVSEVHTGWLRAMVKRTRG